MNSLHPGGRHLFKVDSHPLDSPHGRVNTLRSIHSINSVGVLAQSNFDSIYPFGENDPSPFRTPPPALQSMITAPISREDPLKDWNCQLKVREISLLSCILHRDLRMFISRKAIL